MAEAVLRAVVLVLGVAVMWAGQWTLADLSRFGIAAEYARAHAGWLVPSCLAGIMPAGAAVACVLVVLGGLLIALALGTPAMAPARAVTPVAMPRGSRRFRAAAATIAAALVLAALTAALVRRQPPARAAIVTWVLALAAGWAGWIVLDRLRRTASGNPVRPARELAWPLLLGVVGLALTVPDLGHWRWAGTPDEGHFFDFARRVAMGRSDRFPLSEEGVFGYHPVLSTYVQAAFMKLFGVNAVGWRMASALSLASSMAFTYAFVLQLWGRQAAVAAAVLFGAQPLAVAYSHFGYNNAQVYPVVMGSLAIGAWAFRRRSLAGLYAAGCVAGLGFYTFYSARLAPIFVALCGLAVGAISARRGRRLELVALAFGVALAALPIVARPEEMLGRMLRQTAVTGGRSMTAGEWAPALIETMTAGAGSARLWQHWFVSLVHPVWEKCPGQFQPRQLMDPIGSSLAVVGFWLGVGGLRRDWGSRFLLPAYFFGALVNGAVSQHDCPPLTRLLALAPFVGMLGALGLSRLGAQAAQAARRPAVGWAVTMVAACASAGWNLAALREVVYERNHGWGDGTTSELIRLVQPLPADTQVVYVQHVPTSMQSVDFTMHQYGRGERFTHLQARQDTIPPVPESVAPPFVVAHDLREEARARAVEEPIERRYPGRRFQDSDPGRRWNLRYLIVPVGE